MARKTTTDAGLQTLQISEAGQTGDKDRVGYSAHDRWEDGYEYNENACYIADDVESMKRFLRDAGLEIADYEIRPVTLADMCRDYGCSSGEFALEPLALARFKQLAKTNGIQYRVESFDTGFDEEATLFVVNLYKTTGH